MAVEKVYRVEGYDFATDEATEVFIRDEANDVIFSTFEDGKNTDLIRITKHAFIFIAKEFEQCP